MPYVLRTIGKTANVPTRHFQCDDTSDLPTIDIYLAPMGSTCYVINTGETYVLNSRGKWVKRPTSSGGGSGGGGTGTDRPGWDGGDIDDPTSGGTTIPDDSWDGGDIDGQDGGSIDGSDPY